MDATFAAVLALLVTTAIGLYKDRRNRQWDREDRERKAAEVKAQLTAQASSVETALHTQASHIAESTATHRQRTDDVLAAAAAQMGEVHAQLEMLVTALPAIAGLKLPAIPPPEPTAERRFIEPAQPHTKEPQR